MQGGEKELIACPPSAAKQAGEGFSDQVILLVIDAQSQYWSSSRQRMGCSHQRLRLEALSHELDVAADGWDATRGVKVIGLNDAKPGTLLRRQS